MANRHELNTEEILRRLNERGVDYVVIGAIAAILHGSARNTLDLDICFATDEANLEALGEVLVGLGARLRGVEEEIPFVPDAATLRKVELLCLATTEGDLDVLGRPAGAPAYQALRRRADRYDVGGMRVLVACIDDLIAMKQAAGRGKDLVDIEELEAIKRVRRERSRRRR
jgi:predicted nucleotidyltransferase